MPIIDSQVHAYEANTPKRPRNGAGDRRGRSQCANDQLRLALI
jgi:hypothetical protein